MEHEPIKEKLCPACGIIKPREAFAVARAKKHGIASQCKLCRIERYSNTPTQSKVCHLRNRYGLEWEDYVELWHKQNQKCAICGSFIRLHGENAGNIAHVDHCHETGKVRSLLCPPCNKTLGHARDSIEVLKACVKYLEEHKDGKIS